MTEKSIYLRIGVISGTHGLDGCLKIYVVTDFPQRFFGEIPIYVNVKGYYRSFKINRFDFGNKRTGYLYLEGIEDYESALLLKGCEIFIKRSDITDELSADEFYYSDIIGLKVLKDGAEFGEIVNIIETGSAPVLVIRAYNSKEYMIPFVESMVDTNKINEGIIEIFPIEGLID